jgi:hypothetical protein
MSDEIRTAVDLRASIVDQRGGIERFDGPQRRLLDALVFELAKKPNEIDVRVVTDLMAMLPRSVSAPERDNHPDPRVVLWNIIKEGRDRAALGFEGYDGKVRQVEALQGEVAALKAQLVGAGLAPALPDVACDSTAIDPTEVVPPGEYLGVPPMRGLDDPKRPVTVDAKAVPPAPAARSAPPPRPAWEDWLDAGAGVGSGYDRWADNR